MRCGVAAFTGSPTEPASQSIDAAFRDRGSMGADAAAGVDLAHAGPGRELELSLQRYRAGPRPDLGLQAGVEMPKGDGEARSRGRGPDASGRAAGPGKDATR